MAVYEPGMLSSAQMLAKLADEAIGIVRHLNDKLKPGVTTIVFDQQAIDMIKGNANAIECCMRLNQMTDELIKEQHERQGKED